MGTVLEQLPKKENRKQTTSSYRYMPRVYEVRLPCQWLEHCYDGKCPAFVRQNGNFYCAKAKP